MPRSEHGVGAKIKLNKCVVIPCGALGPMGVGRHPPLFVKFVKAGFFSWEWWIQSAPPPKKKQTKTAVFVAFFRGEGSNIPWLKPTNQSWILSSINMIWKGKFQHSESRMPGVDQKKCIALNANQSTWIWLAWEKLPTVPIMTEKS